MKTKKLLLVFSLLAAVSLSAQERYVVTAQTRLNVRAAMSTNSAVLGTVNHGDTLVVNSITGAWASIIFRQRTGYVSTSYIQLVEDEEEEIVEEIVPIEELIPISNVSNEPAKPKKKYHAGWGVYPMAGYAMRSAYSSQAGKTMPWAYAGFDTDKKVQSGFLFGCMTDIEYTIGKVPWLSAGVMFGLFFEWEGGKWEKNGVENKAHDFSMALPVRGVVRAAVNQNLSFCLYTGPIFDVGLSMKWKSTYEKETTTTDLYQEDHYKEPRLLWGVGVGVCYKRVRLDVTTDWGLTNVADKKVAGKVLMDRPFAITLAYNITSTN